MIWILIIIAILLLIQILQSTKAAEETRQVGRLIQYDLMPCLRENSRLDSFQYSEMDKKLYLVQGFASELLEEVRFQNKDRRL